MEDITFQDYFEPIVGLQYKKAWYPIADIYEPVGDFPDIESKKVVVFGVGEDRAEEGGKSCVGADAVRKQFYNFYPKEFHCGIADLGNLIRGFELKDTYRAVEDICYSLLLQNKIVVILGGTQDLSYAVTRAYARLPHAANIVLIDPTFDMGDPDKAITNKTYMGRAVTQSPNHIYNYTNIGNQAHIIEEEAVDLMERLQFDDYRYGILRESIEESEPPIRDADFISVDMAVVRRGDSPGSAYAFPTGFSAEEMCQMMRYAGMGYQTSVLGLFEYYPKEDRDSISATLIAQMLWYFIEGVEHRINDHPSESSKFEYKAYTVMIEGEETDLEFYKCKQTDRWWMLLPCSEAQKKMYGRHYFIPCSYKDYEWALEHGRPERWWRAYRRLR